MQSATIRPATLADAPFVAWAILEATRSHLGRGWFDIALAESESNCLAFLFDLVTTATASNWHFSRFMVAANRHEPISALSAFRAKDAYPLATAALTETMKTRGMSRSAAACVWTRAAYMFRCTIRPDDDSLVVDTAATAPSWRGQGLTTALLAHALEKAADDGFVQAQVCVFIGNERAERTYLRAGFHLNKERRDPEFETISGAPGVRQYVKTLMPPSTQH